MTLCPDSSLPRSQPSCSSPDAAERSTLDALRRGSLRCGSSTIYNGNLDGAYATLHPAYQRIVPRSRFVACTRAAALGGLDSIEILEVYNDPVDIPGSGEVPAKAVRVRLTSSDGEATTFVNHEVKVGPRWRWVLNGTAANAYRADRCPGG